MKFLNVLLKTSIALFKESMNKNMIECQKKKKKKVINQK